MGRVVRMRVVAACAERRSPRLLNVGSSTTLMRRLPIVRLGEASYFIDERLREIRNVENPHDRADVGDDALTILLRESDGGVDYEARDRIR